MDDGMLKYIKAGAALLACAGVVVSPEMQNDILAGFLAIYSIISAVQAKLKAKAAAKEAANGQG